MNAVRKSKVKELVASGLTPKQAYMEVMKLKLQGQRKVK
jgi:hypothetical protein